MRVHVVSFNCILKNKFGEILSSSVVKEVATLSDSEPVERQVLPDLALALRNCKSGEKKDIQIQAERAYGLYDPKLNFKVLRKELKRGKELGIGDTVHGAWNGSEVNRAYRVVACDSVSVTLDANHPFAGMDLVFQVEVTDAREELSFQELEESQLLN